MRFGPAALAISELWKIAVIHVQKEEFSRQVFVLRKQVEYHDALPADLSAFAHKHGYSFKAVEQTIRDMKHRHGSKWAQDRELATRCLERGKSAAEIIEGLKAYGHQPEFAEKLLFAAQALKGKTEAAREAVEEEVLVEIKPKRRRGLAEFLPSYRTENPESLRAAVLDLMWRLDNSNAVNAHELSAFLLTADSKQAFGALMSLASEGKVKAFEVTGTKFIKFAPASKRMGFFSEDLQSLISLAQMSKSTGIGRQTLSARLKRMTADEAISTPLDLTESAKRKKFGLTVGLTPGLTVEQVSNQNEPKMASSFLSYSLNLNTNTKEPSAPKREQQATPLVGGRAPNTPIPLGAFVENETLDHDDSVESRKIEVPTQISDAIDRAVALTISGAATGAGSAFFAPGRAATAPDGSETPEVTEKAVSVSGWGF